MRPPRSAVVSAVTVAALAGCGDDVREVEILGAHGQADSRELVIAPDDACNLEPRADVVETADEVRVTVTVRGTTNEDCGEGVRISLASTLGDRTIIDGSTGEPVGLADPWE